MAPLRIPNRTARQLWLTAQGLARTPTGALDVLGEIQRLGFVQLDTIQVVARAHHHILWSRNQNYREPMLGQLLADDRSIFEHFTHDASVIPMEFLPMWERQFRRKRAELDRAGWYKNLPDTDARARIKDRIRAEGPLSTHAFDSQIEGPKAMWTRPPHKLALDYMWYVGELATSHRVNFTKYYDLSERVFPQDLRASRMSDEDQIDWLCHAALDRIGFGSAGDIQRFWAASSAVELRAWLARSQESLQLVEIETAQGEWVTAYAPLDIEDRLSALRPVTSRLRILNPFDPVIRDRNRLSRLFGFDYRVEMFKPAAQRIWGYYVFPILEGQRFVGRIEVKADRRASQLQVMAFWPEPGIDWPATRHEKLAAELERMRRFTGVESTVWLT
ncbi:winged helix-turn-helix domain-containing protein [Pararhodobacter oceanensis]|uniref:winged helix-turn-helix domain-containing protein n=1 Tax=Pararhodobacter oceanensis TaxID=2172121 RepID=UPI003A91A34B